MSEYKINTFKKKRDILSESVTKILNKLGSGISEYQLTAANSEKSLLKVEPFKIVDNDLELLLDQEAKSKQQKNVLRKSVWKFRTLKHVGKLNSF